jgi:hypothetical protein
VWRRELIDEEGATRMNARIGIAAAAPWWVTVWGPIATFLLATGLPMGSSANSGEEF